MKYNDGLGSTKHYKKRFCMLHKNDIIMVFKLLNDSSGLDDEYVKMILLW